MSSDRKTLAKYGAKIPAARSTGAKQQPGKQDSAGDAPPKPAQGPKKTAAKKR